MARRRRSKRACRRVSKSNQVIVCQDGRKEGRANGEGRKEGRKDGRTEGGEVAFHGTYEWQRRRSIGRSAYCRERQKRDGLIKPVCLCVSRCPHRRRHLTCFATDRIKPPREGKLGPNHRENQISLWAKRTVLMLCQCHVSKALGIRSKLALCR